MTTWPEFRIAETIGDRLREQPVVAGEVHVSRTRPLVRGPGYAISVTRRDEDRCEIILGDLSWDVSVTGADAPLPPPVVAQVRGAVQAIRSHVSHATLGAGDRLRAVRTSWGVRRGRTFQIVDIMSHQGHDPLVTYVLQGDRVPSGISVLLTADLGAAWVRDPWPDPATGDASAPGGDADRA